MNTGVSFHSPESAAPLVIDGASGLGVTERRGFFFRRRCCVHDGSFAISPPLGGHFGELGSLLIYVHGYNETPEAARGYGRDNIGAGYAASGGRSRVATFVWQSRFGMFRFGNSVRAADSTALAFAKVVQRFQGDFPGLRIHALTHSLGARVVLGGIHRHGVQLHDVALVAPAVDADALEPGGEFSTVSSRVASLLFTTNSADRSLRWYGLLRRRALGWRGYRNPATMPANVHAENMTGDWQSHSKDGGHGAILHPAYWPAFWRKAAEKRLFQ